MKVAMINCSPKLTIRKDEACASRAILQDLKRSLRRFHVHDMEDYHVKTFSLTDEEMKSIFTCDAWVISFPIYTGGIPAHLLRFLQRVEDIAAAGKCPPVKIYAIANSGLFEGNESLPALSMMRIWSEHCAFQWCGGIGIGGGPLYADVRRAYLNITRRRTYGRKLMSLSEAISQGSATLNTFCSPDMSKKTYILYMNRSLKRQARENGLSVMELDKQV